MGKGGKQRQAAKAASQERKKQASNETAPNKEAEIPVAPSDVTEKTAEKAPESAPAAASPGASEAAETPSVTEESEENKKTEEDHDASTRNQPALPSAEPSDNHKTLAPPVAEAPKAESRPDVLERMTAEEREMELRSQVTGLNAKLVDSINRMSDLEDELSVAHNRILIHTTRIAELSKERDQYISAMNTGLLVEKAHVTSEMQRMMERVVEETAQRGKAESDKTRIEAELEDLSAALFNEANSMVAVERLARAKAEEKSQHLETSLRDTERIMQDQQELLKNLQAEVDALRADAPDAPREVPAAEAPPAVTTVPHPIITTNIPPYVEFLQFLSHLRSLHDQLAPYFDMQRRGVDWTTLAPLSASLTSSGVASPSIHQSGSVVRHRDYPHLPMAAENLVLLSSQTTLPFIRRTHDEDADPCLRLSHAPGLNWLTRRQATSAIMDGDVVIEPLFPGGQIPDEAALRAEYGALAPASCALCNVPLLNVSTLLPGASGSSSSSWSNPLKDTQGRRSLPSLFQSLRRGLDRSQPGTQPERGQEVKEGDEIFSQDPAPPMKMETLPIPTHYFRLSDHATSRHLVCSHHCLQRLRVVCAFWTFVRTLERAIVLEGKLEPEYVGQTRIVPAPAAGPLPRPSTEAPSHVSESNQDDAGAREISAEATEKDEADAQAPPAPATEVPETQDGEEAPADTEAKDAKTDEAPAKMENPANTETLTSPKTDTEDEREDLDVFNEALEDHAEAEASLEGGGGAMVPGPPALPARPRSSTVPSRDTFTANSDRSSMSWEESLWAEVIRYKELMWKARVGVDLACLDIG